MLKRPLRSPVSVLKNLKAGTSKIHRNSLLPLRTFENCLKKRGEGGGRNLNSETKCKSQIWWFSVTMGNFQGVGWGGVGRSELVSRWLLCLTDFHLPHPAALLYSALHHPPACLKSIVSDYHVTTA